jgi:hypothetical protein
MFLNVATLKEKWIKFQYINKTGFSFSFSKEFNTVFFQGTSDYLVVFLRLLTSTQIRREADFYQVINRKTVNQLQCSKYLVYPGLLNLTSISEYKKKIVDTEWQTETYQVLLMNTIFDYVLQFSFEVKLLHN